MGRALPPSSLHTPEKSCAVCLTPWCWGVVRTGGLSVNEAFLSPATWGLVRRRDKKSL